MYDSRLVGTWRSDVRKTMAKIRARRDVSGKSRAILRRMFGKLELRYTRVRVHTLFEGTRDAGPYTVVAKDADSVVLRVHDTLLKRDKLLHLVFEGRYYWICLGHFREYFKRVKYPGSM